LRVCLGRSNRGRRPAGTTTPPPTPTRAIGQAMLGVPDESQFGGFVEEDGGFGVCLRGVAQTATGDGARVGYRQSGIAGGRVTTTAGRGFAAALASLRYSSLIRRRRPPIVLESRGRHLRPDWLRRFVRLFSSWTEISVGCDDLLGWDCWFW
jgi:hypothetical protein